MDIQRYLTFKSRFFLIIIFVSGDVGKVVELTFVDMFHIEYHPQCTYDYLEVSIVMFRAIFLIQMPLINYILYYIL